MNHDISHCSGQDVRLLPYGGTEVVKCSICNKCYRHVAYNDPARPPVVSMILPLDCIDHNHNLYYPTQNV
jgi:hypothetical protein